MSIPMKNICSLVSIVMLLSCGCQLPLNKTDTNFHGGILVIAGGGSLPDSIYTAAIESSGGLDVPVLIIPQASRTTTAGPRNKEKFESLGCSAVKILDLSDEATALQSVNSSRLIWISGGDQNRLMKRLPDSIEEAIRHCFERGGVIGGSSAGAAVMSSSMITGKANLEGVEAGATKIAEGLGLIPHAIIDQHFHKRQRFNRLLSAVIDQPKLVGIGIDEGTAVVVQKNHLNVIGKSSVVVLDARGSEVSATNPGPQTDSESTQLLGAQGVRLHLLHDGMSFTFD